MPTKNRRLHITLDPAYSDAIADLAKLTKRPASRVVSELLLEAAPALVEMAAALRLAQKSPQEAVARMVRLTDRVVSDVQQVALPFRTKRGRPRKRG